MPALLHEVMRQKRLDDALAVRLGRSVYDRWAIRRWHRGGRLGRPPNGLKRHVLRDYARRFGLRTLVETGTYYGDTTFGLRHDFDRIVSIELDHALFERAKERLARLRKVTLLEGDSGALIARVLADLAEPALFWLDAHYSGGITARGALDSPVVTELEAIFRHPIRDHVVLIDDARDFSGEGGYPTLRQLRALVRSAHPELSVQVRDDIIRIHRDDSGG